MVELIVGKKGKGKTKVLLDKVNGAIKEANGSIISQDHDLEQIYLDSFLTTAKLEGQDVTNALEQLSAVGEKFNVKFVVSMSLDKEEVPASLQDKIITAL